MNDTMIDHRALDDHPKSVGVEEKRIKNRQTVDGLPTIRVMLPAYNEAGALPDVLDALATTLSAMNVHYEITVVDDGSSDDTAELAREASKEQPIDLVQHPHNQGLAAAMRTGLTHVSRSAGPFDIVVTMDSDNTHPTELLPKMIQMVDEGCDIVVASRFQRGSEIVGLSRFRQLTGVAVNMMFKILLPMRGIRDYTCGYRAYRAGVIRRGLEHYGEDFVSEQGFSCMVDLLLKLRPLGMTCGEVPMRLRYDQKVGDSKMPVFNTIWTTLVLAAKRRFGIFS